jgi:hypothetical protein
MNKTIVIVALISWYALYIYLMPGLPWNSTDHPAIIIAKYVPGLFAIPFVVYSMYSTFSTLSGNEKNDVTQTTLVIGEILDINYSNIRINNKPRFKVSTKFMNFEKEFDPIDGKVNIDFRKGENIFIWVNPNDLNDSYLDLDKSISERNKLVTSII